MTRHSRSHSSRRPHQHEQSRRRQHHPATSNSAASSPAPDNPLVSLLRPALRDRDVTAFWVTASPLIPMLAETAEAEQLPEGVDLLESFIDVDIAESTALLHMIAAMSPRGDFRRRALAALPARRQPLPPQVAGISQAKIGGTAVFGDSSGDNLLVEIQLPKAVRAVLVVYIERHPLPYVKDAFVMGAPLQQVLADYRRIMGAEGFSLDDVLEPLSPAQAGAGLAQALEASPAGTETQKSGGEQWPMLRPFVEFIVSLLPADGPGYDRDGFLLGTAMRDHLADGAPDAGAATDVDGSGIDSADRDDPGETPPWILADGTDLLEEFLASGQARELEPGDATAQLVMFLFLVASGASGDPLAWSPELTEWIAGDFLPTNPVLSPEAMGHVPAVLPALISWAHARTDTDPAEARTALEVARPLLAELPARYADPHHRARRLEEYVRLALESGEPGELRLADLAMRVGGYEELWELEVAPLPAESLLLDGIAEDLHERLLEIDAHMVTGLDQLAEAIPARDAGLFGPEFLTACRRLLARIARLDPAVLRRKASTAITAGALAWIIGRGNDLTGHPPAPLRAKDLQRAFDHSSSPSQRADTLMRAAALPRSVVDVALGDAGLLVSSARQEIIRIRDVVTGA